MPNWCIHFDHYLYMIKLARCCFPVPYRTDLKVSPCTPTFHFFPPFLLIFIFFFFLNFPFARFWPPCPSFSFFLCSKRERMRKPQPADSAVLLVSGLWRQQVWVWVWQAQEVGNTHSHQPRPRPSLAASSPSPTPPSTTLNSTPTNLFPRRPLPPNPRNSWGEIFSDQTGSKWSIHAPFIQSQTSL